MTTDSPWSDPGQFDVWLWFGRPQVGQDHLLFAIVEVEGTLAYRPLLAVTPDLADQLAPMARDAATALGVEPVLGHYKLVSLLDPVVEGGT